MLVVGSNLNLVGVVCTVVTILAFVAMIEIPVIIVTILAVSSIDLVPGLGTMAMDVTTAILVRGGIFFAQLSSSVLLKVRRRRSRRFRSHC